jgi:hypothetical protein
MKVPGFIQLTLVRVKNPQRFMGTARQPDPSDMETVNVDVRADRVVSICSALGSISPPLVVSLVGVDPVGEFHVAESCEEVREVLARELAGPMSDAPRAFSGLLPRHTIVTHVDSTVRFFEVILNEIFAIAPDAPVIPR